MCGFVGIFNLFFIDFVLVRIALLNDDVPRGAQHRRRRQRERQADREQDAREGGRHALNPSEKERGRNRSNDLFIYMEVGGMQGDGHVLVL